MMTETNWREKQAALGVEDGWGGPKVETDLPLYVSLCETLEKAMTCEQRIEVTTHALVACRGARWHRATAIDLLQKRTGLPRRLAENFIDSDFEATARRED